jgi:HK97 family phage portal protein
MLGVDSFDAAQRVLSEPFEPFISTGGIPVADPGSPLDYWTKADVDSFWRSQPNVRKVIGYVARNTASIPLHLYERVSDTDRRRLTGEPLSSLLSQPSPGRGAYRFWESVLSDGLLYDRWAVLKERDKDTGALTLLHVPSWRLYFRTDVFRRVVSAWFWKDDSTLPASEQWMELPLKDLIYDYGYAPRTAGLSPIETLKDILDESREAVGYRRQVWENGGRAAQWIKRPMEAKWEDTQRNRFVNGLRKFKRDGSQAGGIMLLEDGMELHDSKLGTSADLLDLEGRQLTAVEVASAFYVAPELVGAREGNFSNIDAFRQMAYRDSLGPYITAWEQAVNVGLTPEFADGRPIYVEANVETKLRGSFIEQAQILQSATGGPWLTRNEARSLQNRPPIDGGDELIVPLNVVVGGQASPRDSGTQNLRGRSKLGGVRVKATAPDSHTDKHAEILSAFFARQGRSVVSRVGSGDSWWDGKRWDGELSTELAGLYLLTATEAGRDTLAKVGIEPDQYDEPRTQAFLLEAARRSAKSINEATRAAVEDALAEADGDTDPTEAASHVFDVAESSRAGEIAASSVAFAAGFGSVEAARQQSDRATKTWVVNSGNPRSSHAAMDGETVGIDDTFSNGLAWPGSFGDADEVAGCQCSVEISLS